MKKKSKKKVFLNKDEKEILASVERGEWKSVPKLKQEIALAKKAATNSLRKNARINIRLSSTDLEHLKLKAIYEGIPYQTLIASILHKYVSGHLDC